MSDLSGFLLARLAYDARVYGGHQHGLPQRLAAHLLADCKAKRRIVVRCGLVLEAFSAQNGGPGRPLWTVGRRERHHANETLHDLALPYAAHPDYREEWRP